MSQNLFFAHLQDVHSQPVKLESIGPDSEGEVLLSWNSQTQETLLINYRLPEISEEEQFQLWGYY